MAQKKGMGAGMWVIMGLLILSLGGFGVTQFGSSVSTVAEVGDVEITADQYARAVQGQMDQFQQQMRQPVNFQTAQALGLDRIALGQIIAAAAIENEARAAGLSVGDEIVGEEVQSLPPFQSAAGFDRTAYEMALRQNGTNPRDFENTIRSDIASELVRRAIVSGIETPDIFTDTLFNHAREIRDVTWARLTEEDLLAPVAPPTDAELAAFHEENPLDFTSPEVKVIHYAWLTPDMLAPDIEVSDDQLRTLYDTRINEFVSPERRLLERLVFSTQSDAEAARARIDSGEITFDGLVAERGLNLADIDMGDVSEADLGSIGADIFALSEPGVIGPLQSSLGPALFRMNGVLAAENVDFLEAREALAPEAALDRARRMINDRIGEIEDLLAGGADPSVIAERTGLQDARIEWSTEVFDGIAAYQEFRLAASRAAPGDFGEVVQLEDGGVFTLTVEEVRAPALIPLEEIEGEVILAWTRQATQDALEARANQLADELRNGREMAGMDLNLETNRGLTRDGFVEGTPPNFLTALFELERDGIGVVASDGNAWLLRLDAIVAADSASPDAQLLKDRFAFETANSFATAITNAFTQALVDEAGADINQAAINAVNSAAFLGGGAHGGM